MKINSGYIILFSLFFTLNSYAQFGAKFYVVSDIGCAPFTVSVIDSSGAPANNVNVYNYGENATFVQDTFYTYTDPGIYLITQVVANGDPRDDSLYIEVVAPQTPTFNLSNCKGTEAFFHGDDTLYNAFYVDWGDGNSEIILNKQIQQHLYGALGVYSITVHGMMDPNQSETYLANVNCNTVFTTLNLVADIVPGTIDRIEVLNADSILLNFSLDPNTSYYLEQSQNGSSSFNIIDTLSVNSLPANYIINNLDTDQNYYCFRLTAFDPCDGATTPSQTACSVNLESTANNNENFLNWSTETNDLNTYNIERDGNIITSTTSTNYTDASVQCGVEYCYQVVLNENNGLQSISNISCITAISLDQPPTIGEINTTINNDIPVLTWDIPPTPPSVYHIRRYDADGSNPTNFTTLSNNFSDSSASPSSKQYFYEITYEDLCGNISPPTITSPVFLSAYLTPTIIWTNYIGWQSGVNSYYLEIYDQQQQLIDEIEIGLDTTYTETDFENLPQEIIYRIRILPSVSGLPQLQSNYLKTTFPSNVVFPNAFTPNNDGLNDVFTFKGLYVSSFEMTIFNKWGELIYHTQNPDTGWDGTINSKPVSSGMYIFKAEFTDEAGISFVKKGEVYLLR